MFHRPAETIWTKKKSRRPCSDFRRRFETKPRQLALPIPKKNASNAVQYKNCQRINAHQSTDSDTLFQLTKLADAPLRAARNKATLVFAAERTPLRTAR